MTAATHALRCLTGSEQGAPRPAPLLWALAAALLAGPAAGTVEPPSRTPAPRPVAAAPARPASRIVVRYARDIATAVDLAFARRGRVAGDAGVPAEAGPEIDALHGELGVRRIEPVFARAVNAETSAPAAEVFRSRASRLRAARRAGSRAGSRGRAAPAGNIEALARVYALEIDPTVDPTVAAARLAASPWVEYAQPDWTVHKLESPSDPLARSTGTFGQPYPDLWGLYAVRAPEAWAWTRGMGPNGEPVLVAVVDTGIDPDHEDLRSRIWSNPGEIPGNGIDDDGNGYVDDVHGWDFTECRRFTRSGRCQEKLPDNDPTDGDGHGTHVAGTIAAEADNGVGIAGVAPQARILPVKALDDRGSGLVSWLAAGIVYAAANGARVINNSWGCSYCPENPVVEDAVRFAHEAGAVVVFAAGNSASDVALVSPQNMTDPKPVVVAACTPDLDRARFSSFGRQVDLCAPGGGKGDDLYNVVSARARRCGGRSCPRGLRLGKRYVRLAGTSMAAPHVAGVAALLLARFPSLGPDEVRAILRASARDAGSPGLDIHTGAGMVDAASALASAASATARIDAPRDGAAFEPGSGAIAVRATISAADLTGWELLLGGGAAPAEWTPIASGTEAAAGEVVARIEPEQLSTGLHVLRLAATTSSGRVFQDLVRFAFEHPPRQVSPSLAMQLSPSVDGAHVAWTETDAASGEAVVRVADLDAGTVREIRGSGGFDSSPSVAFPWVDFLTFRGGSWDICTFDLRAAALEAVTSDDRDQLGPRGDGEVLAYLSCRGRSYRSCIDRARRDVYLYDRRTGVRTALTADGRPRADVVVRGRYVAWTEYRRGTGTVWLHDRLRGTTEAAVLDAVGSQGSPVLDERHLAWEEYDPAAGVWRLRVRDLESGSVRWVTGDSSHAIAPALSGGRLAWMTSENGNWDIAVADLASGDVRLVTAHPAPQLYPDLSCDAGGCRVVWMDQRSDGVRGAAVWNIYMATLP